MTDTKRLIQPAKPCYQRCETEHAMPSDLARPPPQSDQAAIQSICGKLVEREVGHCVSSLVHHLANNPDALKGSDYTWEDDVLPLCEQEDWESTWEDYVYNGEGHDLTPDDDVQDDYQEACEDVGIDEPFRNEAYEHWIVSGWFGRKLREHGEMVGELFGLTIWGRCTTGQSISMDDVIKKIASDMEILPGQQYEWTD